MNGLRAAWRLMRAVIHALHGFATILFLFPGWGDARRQARVQSWSREMLECIGVTLEVRGNPPRTGPVLLAANHISWLDILVMHAARHCRFVAKSEVRHWPLIGRMATAGGTLYIERESRRDAMRVVHRMAESLGRGEILAVFPEGTTSDGTTLLPFHGNLIQAAVATGTPVQPVALRFIDRASGEPSLTPCYIGDDTLLGSVWSTLSGPPIAAVVSYGEPEWAHGRDRRTWAGDLRTVVDDLRRS
ncbi:lysophospholipid acyltransferase family protein [Caenimonas aquaedulcis]|uniref:1-acyl-sn-glycerol-3-phosphate acyltransferase n=1 Tax=Caenimonas aquaedulcis TaxID=2793270 RepID=A0A931MI59_9BURK|nr:lysophospholipid acyltransferase family protein [Caenimonas aquaedulcis]MBG9389494.1 1-acyl-sn-glycerol-3-phosphate acyltransferase [Caenimonas aquaedulcis]